MEKFKLFLNSEDARKFLREGIIKAAEAVAPTLGVKGRKIILDKEYGNLSVIDDGFAILKELEFEDPKLQMGVKLLREVATKTNDRVGDGTSTSTILAKELVSNLISDNKTILFNKLDSYKVEKEVESGAQKVVDFIDANKFEVTPEKAEQIGTISSNSKELGKIIADLVNELGKDASIVVQDNNKFETVSEIVKGMKVEKGMLAKAMVTDTIKRQAVIENANILITTYAINNPSDVDVLVSLFRDHKINDVLIIANNVDGVPLETLIFNKLSGGLRVVAIKEPPFGDAKEILEDIAVATGATLIDKQNGLDFSVEHVTPDKLGKADKVIVSFDETNILSGKGEQTKIEERIKTLEQQLVDTKSEFDKEQLRTRISRLRGGVGIIKVGGMTEAEIGAKKAKLDDAINAVKASLKDGGIPGAGVMLLRASSVLDESVEGERILKKAIEKPFEQLIENAGLNVNDIKEKVLASDNPNFGYDVEAEEFGDLVEKGVIDPSLVAKTALQNAVSIALLVSSVGGANTLIRKDDEDKPKMPSGYME